MLGGVVEGGEVMNGLQDSLEDLGDTFQDLYSRYRIRGRT